MKRPPPQRGFRGRTPDATSSQRQKSVENSGRYRPPPRLTPNRSIATPVSAISMRPTRQISESSSSSSSSSSSASTPINKNITTKEPDSIRQDLTAQFFGAARSNYSSKSTNKSEVYDVFQNNSNNSSIPSKPTALPAPTKVTSVPSKQVTSVPSKPTSLPRSVTALPKPSKNPVLSSRDLAAMEDSGSSDTSDSDQDELAALHAMVLGRHAADKQHHDAIANIKLPKPVSNAPRSRASTPVSAVSKHSARREHKPIHTHNSTTNNTPMNTTNMNNTTGAIAGNRLRPPRTRTPTIDRRGRQGHSSGRRSQNANITIPSSNSNGGLSNGTLSNTSSQRGLRGMNVGLPESDYTDESVKITNHSWHGVEGHVYRKQPGSLPFSSKWRKEYLAVTANFLVCFDDNPAASKLHATKCFGSGMTDTVRQAYALFSIQEVEHKEASSGADAKGAHYCFKVVLSSKNVSFACESEQQRDLFVNAIREARDDCIQSQNKNSGNLFAGYISLARAEQFNQKHVEVTKRREQKWKRQNKELENLTHVAAANALACQLLRLQKKLMSESLDQWKNANLRGIKASVKQRLVGAGRTALAVVLRNIVHFIPQHINSCYQISRFIFFCEIGVGKVSVCVFKMALLGEPRPPPPYFRNLRGCDHERSTYYIVQNVF